MAKVLVVEENPSVVTSILVQLKLAGHLARAMENLQAAETLINEARVDRFDAIIYNPLLSSLDGYALLSDLKNHEETKDIPVIGYSEELDQLSKQRFRDLGAECHYGHGNVDFEEIVRRLEKILSNKQKYEA